MSTQLQGLLKRLDEIVDGIDRDESDGGWWETEKGVELGKTTLRELRQLVTEAAQSAEARAALADEPAVPEDREPVAVAGQPSDQEGPSAEDVEELCEEHFFNVDGYESIECLQGLINEAIARWGNPAPLPLRSYAETGRYNGDSTVQGSRG